MPELGSDRPVARAQIPADPIETLSQQSGVSAEALKTLSPAELHGMQDLERTISQTSAAVERGEMSQETYDAAVVARDGVRALVEGRVATTEPEESSRDLSLAGAPQDAHLTIRDNTITIQSRIYIYGSGASQQVADDYERQIQQDWGQNPATGAPWTFPDHLTGRDYTVRFDVDVRLLNPQDPHEVPLVIPETFDV